jgi:hypothetical protein
MNHKVGDKFVIEIGEVYSNGLPFADDNEPCTLYRIKGFKSLVFDENGIDRLEKLEEKKEPPVDWSKVAVDTPILVSNSGNYWYRRYFAKYINGKVCSFSQGATSWSNNNGMPLCEWEYAKLAER